MEKHIETFNLSVSVMWLGDSLRPAIDKLMVLMQSDSYAKQQRKFVVLDRHPSFVTAGSVDFEPMLMPNCEVMLAHNIFECSYELLPIIKYHERPLKDVEVQHLAQKMSFLKTQYREIIRMYERALEAGNDGHQQAAVDVFNAVACDWINTNERVIQSWTASFKSSKRIVHIAGLFPKANSNFGNVDTVAQMAVDAVNAHSDILSDYELMLLTSSTDCHSDLILKSFIHYNVLEETNSIVGVLGPACSDAIDSISILSEIFHMITISYAASGTSFNHKTHPYFFRTIGENRHFEPVFVQIMKKYNWRRVATLSEDGQKYTEYLSSSFETQMKRNGIEVLVHKKLPRFLNTSAEVQQNLNDLINRNARVIVAEIYNEMSLLRVMCEAYHLHLTAHDGYVWFVPAWIKDHMNANLSGINCTRDELKAALTFQFALNYESFGSDGDFVPHLNETVGDWKHRYTRNVSMDRPSEYAGFVFDAVWTFAKAADQVLREHPNHIVDLHSANATQDLVAAIEQLNFQGVSGRIAFDADHSRWTNINVMQWTANGTTQLVATYFPEDSFETGVINFTAGLDLWPNIKMPTDGSHVCSLKLIVNMFGGDCESAVLGTTIFASFVIIIVASVTFYMYWKRMYNEKIKVSAEVMRNFGIDLLNTGSMPENTLDKWEIPKEQIVVNRKLGEGAFGTVYGGEAKINGEERTAVAVKTLKIGSTAEDRLDFLTEAEAMKRFDHKNILKLVGVCLQSEPIFTIFEFMLHGDLKTYLLERRAHVNGKISDDSDISPKRLTMMTLDISRGLAYLAEQKYVHRDIACRNCLVNAQCVVKIGDFGMARPMFESDYYKFNRKGLLPVRWLSPESLGLVSCVPRFD